MVMDLVEAGELLSVIRHHKDLKVAAGVAGEACGRETSRFYLGELVLALEYLHSEGIVHRGEGRRRQAAASPSLLLAEPTTVLALCCPCTCCVICFRYKAREYPGLGGRAHQGGVMHSQALPAISVAGLTDHLCDGVGCWFS